MGSGSYEGWSGKGDPLFDEDGDHIYTAVVRFTKWRSCRTNTQSTVGALKPPVLLSAQSVILILKMEMILWISLKETLTRLHIWWWRE